MVMRLAAPQSNGRATHCDVTQDNGLFLFRLGVRLSGVE